MLFLYDVCVVNSLTASREDPVDLHWALGGVLDAELVIALHCGGEVILVVGTLGDLFVEDAALRVCQLEGQVDVLL